MRWSNLVSGTTVLAGPRPGRLDSGAGRGGWRGQGGGSRRHGYRGSTERFCDDGGAAAADVAVHLADSGRGPARTSAVGLRRVRLGRVRRGVAARVSAAL